MEQAKLTTGAILGNAMRHFWAHKMLTGLTLVGLFLSSLIGFTYLSLAVLSYAQFELTYEMLADDDLLSEGYGKRRFVAVLGLQLITGAAFAIGWLLFILPGIYLMLRLSLAVPALVSEEAGVFEALLISWRRTARQELALLGAMAGAVLPAILLWGALLAFTAARMGTGIIAITAIAAILLSGLTMIFCWCIAAAAYGATRIDEVNLEQVFA